MEVGMLKIPARTLTNLQFSIFSRGRLKWKKLVVYNITIVLIPNVSFIVNE